MMHPRSSLSADTAYVRIFVTDVNDNAPSFPQPLYEVSAEEGQEVGVILVTVTANDEDEGESQELPFLFCSPPSVAAPA